MGKKKGSNPPPPEGVKRPEPPPGPPLVVNEELKLFRRKNNLSKRGDKVWMNAINVEGIIRGVCISGSTTYEVSYWWDGVRKKEWLEEDEFTLIDK